MKQITVLSGKGGVGKSSITASLAVTLAKTQKVVCADCDVDAANLALILGIEEFKDEHSISVKQIAKFDMDKCTGCGKCKDICYFDAIGWKDGKPYLKEFGCEGCGVCPVVCPFNAIKLVDVKNAKIGTATTKYGFPIITGQLEVGQSGSGKIVAKVKDLAKQQDADYMIIDAAAGIGCPVIASIVGSDYVIAVTEPTPSGISDLKRVLTIVEHFNIPYSVILNKYDINPGYYKEDVLAKIPYDKNFVNALTALKPIVAYDEKYKEIFNQIADFIVEEVK